MRMLNASMHDLVGLLQEQVDKPVTDATELQGKYDFVLAWSADSGTATAVGAGDDTSDVDVPDDSGPDLFAALQEQLGLKLEKAKGSVEILVIDHIEKVPSRTRQAVIEEIMETCRSSDLGTWSRTLQLGWLF